MVHTQIDLSRCIPNNTSIVFAQLGGYNIIYHNSFGYLITVINLQSTATQLESS